MKNYENLQILNEGTDGTAKMSIPGQINDWLYEALKQHQSVNQQRHVYQDFYSTQPNKETQSLTFL